HALQMSQRDRPRTGIPNLDASDATGSEGRCQNAEAICKVEQWSKTTHLISAEAGRVDRARQISVYQRRAHGFRDLDRHVLLGFGGRSAKVRRKHDVLERTQRMGA